MTAVFTVQVNLMLEKSFKAYDGIFFNYDLIWVSKFDVPKIGIQMSKLA